MGVGGSMGPASFPELNGDATVTDPGRSGWRLWEDYVTVGQRREKHFWSQEEEKQQKHRRDKVNLAKEREVTPLVSPSCISRYSRQQWSRFPGATSERVRAATPARLCICLCAECPNHYTCVPQSMPEIPSLQMLYAGTFSWQCSWHIPDSRGQSLWVTARSRS